MTQYQIIKLKRAVRQQLIKERKQSRKLQFPSDRKLPDYVTNNPWY